MHFLEELKFLLKFAASFWAILFCLIVWMETCWINPSDYRPNDNLDAGRD